MRTFEVVPIMKQTSCSFTYHLIYILINFYGTYHLRLAENELNNHSGTSNSALGGLSLKLTSHLMNKILFRKYQLRQGSFIGSLTHFLL